MKATKKDRFKEIIKLAPPDKPAIGFTDAVMHSVAAEAQRELALKKLLQKQQVESVSFDFTTNVMAQIDTVNSPIGYRPIITPKVWCGIAAVITVFLGLIGLSNPSASNTSGQNSIAVILKYTHAIPAIYLMALIAGFILLLVDYLLSQRLNRRIA